MGWRTACTTSLAPRPFIKWKTFLVRKYSLIKSNLLPSLPQHGLAHWHQKGCWEPINQCYKTDQNKTKTNISKILQKRLKAKHNLNQTEHTQNTWQQVFGRSSWCCSGPSDGRGHSQQTAVCPLRLSLYCTAPSDLACEHSLAGSGSVQLPVRLGEWAM